MPACAPKRRKYSAPQRGTKRPRDENLAAVAAVARLRSDRAGAHARPPDLEARIALLKAACTDNPP